MTKQWATVLILVTVISTSFYLMNRPRSQQDSSSGTRGDGSVADELARKNRDRRPTEASNNDDERLDSTDESESMDEPEVPATRTDASTTSNEESDTSDLQDEVSLIPTRRYPSTDPQRYEFRPLEIRNAERGSPTSSR